MMASSVSALRSRTRGIAQLTAGRTHGPITRLMSPGDLGEVVLSLVLLVLLYDFALIDLITINFCCFKF